MAATNNDGTMVKVFDYKVNLLQEMEEGHLVRYLRDLIRMTMLWLLRK